MNSVNLIGNIGHNLELRHTQNGKSVLNLSLAVENYNGEAEWFRIVIWNQQAENTVKYCSKGSTIGISGRLATNEYTDKNGNQRTNVEVVAQTVKFLSYENNQGNTGNNNRNWENNSNYGTNQPNVEQNNQNFGQQNNFTGQPEEDPFDSSIDPTDISDDDLPF